MTYGSIRDNVIRAWEGWSTNTTQGTAPAPDSRRFDTWDYNPNPTDTAAMQTLQNTTSQTIENTFTANEAGLTRPGYIPVTLWMVWLDAYIEAGGAGNPNAGVIANNAMRADPSYDTYFAGNRREDGSFRMDEATYATTVDSYRNVVEGLGLNPDIFGMEYVSLIEGSVGAPEFASRANALYDRVMRQAPAIREWYASIQGIAVTDEAILASLMSENVATAILNREITMAEIGGEASLRNFDLTKQFVDALAANGMDRAEAQQMFGTADRLIPMLSAMATRHGDPNDAFDIYEFVNAYEFMDADVLNRIGLVQAQEASSFTGGAQVDIARNQQGGLSGLVEL